VAASQDALRLERRGAFEARRCLDTFRLPAVGPSVAEARRRVRGRLREWGVDDGAASDTEMLVSELFTNALRHTASERIVCALVVTGDLVRIEVTDEGSPLTEPRPREAGFDEEGGRGLLLVGALSDAWGVRAARTGHGRTVWAELSAWSGQPG
jgi:anti-sigma regulatory factor (Ser/Thr protein kinase)